MTAGYCDGHVTGGCCRQERRLQRFETECEEQRVRQMKRQEKRAQATEDYLLKQRVQTQHCPLHYASDPQRCIINIFKETSHVFRCVVHSKIVKCAVKF